MANIPTVRIVDGDDYRIINKSDFDPDGMTLYGEDAAAEAVSKPAPEVPLNPDPPDEGGEETREQLVARAKELGIKPNARWKDATLKRKIAEAEAG